MREHAYMLSYHIATEFDQFKRISSILDVQLDGVDRHNHTSHIVVISCLYVRACVQYCTIKFPKAKLEKKIRKK